MSNENPLLYEVVIKIDRSEHDKIILTGPDGNTFTSTSEPLIDFFTVRRKEDILTEYKRRLKEELGKLIEDSFDEEYYAYERVNALIYSNRPK